MIIKKEDRIKLSKFSENGSKQKHFDTQADQELTVLKKELEKRLIAFFSLTNNHTNYE